MKNFLTLIAFASTTIIGLFFAGSLNKSGKIRDLFHHDCVRWTDETFDKRLFDIGDVNRLMGKKVISKSAKFGDDRTGKIIFFERAATNKFLVGIYWGNGVEDANSKLTFHDKEWFEKNFELTD